MKRKILNELYLYPKSLNATTYKKVSISNLLKLIGQNKIKEVSIRKTKYLV